MEGSMEEEWFDLNPAVAGIGLAHNDDNSSANDDFIFHASLLALSWLPFHSFLLPLRLSGLLVPCSLTFLPTLILFGSNSALLPYVPARFDPPYRLERS